MSLLEAQLEARNLLQQRPLFLHCKSTGAAELSEVVEIAILDSDGAPLVDELAKPKRHIRQVASLEHGITDEMVEHAPKWGEILPQVEEILERKTVVVYDFATVMLVLRNSYQNDHHRWALDQTNFFDLMALFSRHKNERISPTGLLKQFSLEDATRMLGIDIEIIGYRRAREDAWLMRALLLAIAGWKVYY